MSKTFIAIAALVIGLTTAVAAAEEGGSWRGVDETVVEKLSAAAVRPARRPFIDIEQGDLPLFMFLTAGAIGGFIAGYMYRGLFGKSPEKTTNQHASGS